jgi:hypothetical protein
MGIAVFLLQKVLLMIPQDEKKSNAACTGMHAHTLSMQSTAEEWKA